MDGLLKMDKDNLARLEIFSQEYMIEGIFKCDQGRKTYICSDYDRKCRFCQREKPRTKFKKRAHVIPQLLNNKTLLSRFECDECNEIFSKYETSLASFVGPFRSLAGLGGRKGKNTPKHIDPHSGLQIAGDKGHIEVVFRNQNEVTVDEERKEILFKLTKQSYIPIHVYKSLLKVGLCLIEDNEVEDYRIAYKLLISGTQRPPLPLAMLFMYFVPGMFNEETAAVLYKKRADRKQSKCPTHTMALYFSNHLYQIFLPLNVHDKWMYKIGEKISLPIMPLMIDQDHLLQYGQYQIFKFDLSSSEKKIGEPAEVSLNFEMMNQQL
jgi:hypothetical protein